MKKKTYLFYLCSLLFVSVVMGQSRKNKDPNAPLRFSKTNGTDLKALTHFADEKFGVMLTWGPYTLNGAEASWSMSNRAAYEAVYNKWKPSGFDANQWGDLIKTLGAKYLVWVTKHHDGLCLWDTKTTDNNIMHFAYHEDITADLANMCKKYGLDFGTYLSIIDAHASGWNRIYPSKAKMPGFPADLAPIAALTTAQSLELIKKFHPDIIWFDGAWLDGWRKSVYPGEMAREIRRVAPSILMTRLGNGLDDFESMEAKIGTYQPYAWETVTSVAYPRYSWTTELKYKSVPFLIESLCRVVCGNGNYLLNFIPDPDGRIPTPQQRIATEMGAWVGKNAKAIFGTRGGPYYPDNWGGSTNKGNKVYLYLFGDAPQQLSLPPIGAKIRKVKVLDGGSITVKSSRSTLMVEAPVSQRGPNGVSVIELTLNHPVKGMIEASNPKRAIKGSLNKEVLPIQQRAGKVIN